MSGLRWLDIPFRYTTNQDFQHKLMQWLGDVFYETLPSHGYEVREEQIYTTFRMAEALCHRETLLAEAGSGTGKTFAYLLPAVCYARHIGKPVILSSASSLLQEQLAGKGGDIGELSRLLHLNIDARVAKDPHNYLCQKKAEREPWLDADTPGLQQLNEWMLETTLGDRAEIPEVSDEVWQTVAWDETLACDQCQHRGYCQVAKNRLHVWAATDFVIASHDQFFRHLWSKVQREDEGLPPLLPASSATIFDEGHLLERPAIEQLGHALRREPITGIYHTMWAHRRQLRGQLLVTLDGLQEHAKRFFSTAEQAAIPDEALQRWFVQPTDEFNRLAQRLLQSLQETSYQLAVDMEQLLWTPLEVQLRVASQRVDQAEAALQQLTQPDAANVVWWEADSETLWVLPRSFGTLIGQKLTAERQPLLFTSATLQAAGSFTGMKQMIGLPDAKESRVATSFQLASQMAAYLPPQPLTSFTERAEECLRLLIENQGSALVLLNNAMEMRQWKDFLQDNDLSFPLLWEGDGERGWVLTQFRRQLPSVLSGTSFWEGVDVPGEALSLVVVFSLPFPEADPLLLNKRQISESAGLDPWLTVDLTQMLIKLRQGYGRLIRTAKDQGVVAVLDMGENGEHRDLVGQALPKGVLIMNRFNEAREIVRRQNRS